MPSSRALSMMFAVFGLLLAPGQVLAQARVGKDELAQARKLLERSRPELTSEQWALLSGKLAGAELAFVALTTAAEAAGGTALVATESTAAVVVDSALTGSATRLFPLLALLWPATAHAPGVKQEPAAVREARTKLENSLKELALAARQVEAQRTAAAVEAKRPDDSEICKRFAEGGTGGPERFCHYKCGNQNICVRVPGTQQCPDGSPKISMSPIKFSKLARLPGCPPLETLN